MLPRCRRPQWYEPDAWRFGDPTHPEGSINYMRHASGQIYGLSRQVGTAVAGNGAHRLHLLSFPSQSTVGTCALHGSAAP